MARAICNRLRQVTDRGVVSNRLIRSDLQEIQEFIAHAASSWLHLSKNHTYRHRQPELDSLGTSDGLLICRDDLIPFGRLPPVDQVHVDCAFASIQLFKHQNISVSSISGHCQGLV